MSSLFLVERIERRHVMLAHVGSIPATLICFIPPFVLKVRMREFAILKLFSELLKEQICSIKDTISAVYLVPLTTCTP